MIGGECRSQFMRRDDAPPFDLPHQVVHLNRSGNHTAPLAPGTSHSPRDLHDLGEIIRVMQLLGPGFLVGHFVGTSSGGLR